MPVLAITNATYDDAWFVAKAQSIASGHWLGRYDQMTLIKGVFYPLFVAASSATGLPLPIAEQLVYLLACAGVARLLTRSVGGSTVLFGLLAFNPALWHSELSRVIREGLYVGLSLACIGLAAAATFAPARIRIRLAFGLAVGAFWLTREEGPWLLPALGAVLGAGLALPDGTGLRRRAARIARSWATGGAVALAMVLAVATVSWARYGVFLTTEFQGGASPRAYGALARVTPDRWQPYVVFPADAQARAFAVSPAAAELAPALAGPIGRNWADVGCRQTGTDPCPGILSGWFMWALRDAAAAAGHHRSARDAQAFYDRVATEINAACDSGKLPCGPPNAGFAPPFRSEDLGHIAQSAQLLAGLMVTVGPEWIVTPPSVGPPATLARWSGIVGPIALEDATTFPQAPALRVRIAQSVSRLYRLCVPPAAALAALGVLATLAPPCRRSLPPRQVAFAWACLAAVLSRLLLLAYLDATSIPSVNALYASPASPFVIAFVGVGCMMGWACVRRAGWRLHP